MDIGISKTELEQDLLKKLKVLNETTWENRANASNIRDWLNNFSSQEEKVHALFLLSQFMYFNSIQMRILLKALYRDLFKYSIIEDIRKANTNTTDVQFIEEAYNDQLIDTRFLGVGNPSESGVHLLYFFRQENNLSKRLFINTHEIFKKTATGLELRMPEVKNYVFIDDFCGSGEQAKSYLSNIVDDIKRLDKKVRLHYLMLFATSDGKDAVKKETRFDRVDAVFELNHTFKCFGKDSRYFINNPKEIRIDFAREFVGTYGEKLMKSIIKKESPRLDNKIVEELSEKYKFGYKNGQLLIGFHHNTPDNALPILWYDENELPWNPIFRRYNKKYAR